jgi:hypothetical protein
MITHRTRSGWSAPLRFLMTVLSIVILLAFSIVPNSVSAQTGVVGRVVDPAGKTAITDARVSAHDDRGREHAVTLTDSIGYFKLRLLPGSYYLQSLRVGYEPTRTGTVDFSDDEQVEVIIQMSARPLGVDPLVVVGRRNATGRLREYYDRLDRDVGRGRFITRAMIDSLDAPGITSYMEQHGVPMSMSLRTGEKWPLGVGRCRMHVFIDGVNIDERGGVAFDIDALVRPADIEGVEIYRSSYEAPAQYQTRLSTCGIVLIWTRMDKRDGMPFWKGILVAGGAIGSILLLRGLWLK